MNSAKKIMKNGGENATQSTVKQSRGLSKNMILILVGIILVAVLGGGVCYVNLRPRAILTVEGKDADGKTVTHTINYPEAMYDIYQAEAMASMYQMYGMSFDWSDTTEDGDTYAALYKKQIMQALKKREILYMCAQKKGMTLTDEEKKTIKEDVKSARKNMTDSQKAMKGLDEATITTVKEKDKLGEKYKDSIVSTLKIDKDKLKKSVDKKSYRQYTLQYYTFAKTETGSDNKTKDKDAKTLEQGKKDMIALQKKAASAKDFTKDVITDKDNDKVDDNNKGISYSTKDLIETDTDFTVFDFRMLFQIGYRRNNLRDTRFVIGAQQSLSVGDNQIFSLMVEQFRELGGRKNHFPFCAKNNILAVVILHNARRDIFSAHIGTCIHVRDEADNRHRLICIGRKGGKQITVFIQRNIFQTQRFQFFFQKPGKYHLPRSTRSYSTLLIRLRIETYIL